MVTRVLLSTVRNNGSDGVIIPVISSDFQSETIALEAVGTLVATSDYEQVWEITSDTQCYAYFDTPANFAGTYTTHKALILAGQTRPFSAIKGHSVRISAT